MTAIAVPLLEKYQYSLFMLVLSDQGGYFSLKLVSLIP